MAEPIRDLDAALAEHRLEGRLETSMTLKEMTDRLDASPLSYVRDGLGTWNALAVHFAGFGDLIVAAPADLDDAGCSIWYAPDARLNDRTVASLLSELAAPETPMFCNSLSGAPVHPDPDLTQGRAARRDTLEVHELGQAMASRLREP